MEEETKKDEGSEAQVDEKEEKPLEKMTAIELREVAKEIPGVTGVTAMKKDELLAVIKEARGIKDESPAKKGSKRPAKKEVNVKFLKEKIIILKGEKTNAQKEKDRKKVDVLRRRINRMKKLTRKVAQG